MESIYVSVKCWNIDHIDFAQHFISERAEQINIASQFAAFVSFENWYNEQTHLNDEFSYIWQFEVIINIFYRTVRYGKVTNEITQKLTM